MYHEAGADGVMVAAIALAWLKNLGEAKSIIDETDNGITNASDIIDADGPGGLVARADLIKNFEARLKGLPDKGATFLDDFKDANEEILEQFLRNPELVDSWKLIDDELADAGELIRKSPDALKQVDDAIKEGLDGTDAVQDAVQRLGKTKPTWPE